MPYEVKPAVDLSQYSEIPGCEGPMVLQSGRVVYYDRIMGKYYDSRRDIYLTIEEYHAEWTFSNREAN